MYHIQGIPLGDRAIHHILLSVLVLLNIKAFVSYIFPSNFHEIYHREGK